MTKQNEVLELVSAAIGISVERLSLDTAVENTEEWDSITHINIILSLEARYKIGIDPEVAAELTSIRALIDYVTRHAS
jgi:acyl carrier protein